MMHPNCRRPVSTVTPPILTSTFRPSSRKFEMRTTPPKKQSLPTMEFPKKLSGPNHVLAAGDDILDIRCKATPLSGPRLDRPAEQGVVRDKRSRADIDVPLESRPRHNPHSLAYHDIPRDFDPVLYDRRRVDGRPHPCNMSLNRRENIPDIPYAGIQNRVLDTIRCTVSSPQKCSKLVPATSKARTSKKFPSSKSPMRHPPVSPLNRRVLKEYLLSVGYRRLISSHLSGVPRAISVEAHLPRTSSRYLGLSLAPA